MSAPASGRLTSSTASTSAKASAPPAAMVAPPIAVHRVAVPNGSRFSAAAAMWIRIMPPSVMATTSASSSEGMTASAAPASAIGGTRPANHVSGENTPGAGSESAIGARRTGALRMNPAAEKYATPTRSTSQPGSAGTGQGTADGDDRQRGHGDDRPRESGYPNPSRRRPREDQGHEGRGDHDDGSAEGRRSGEGRELRGTGEGDDGGHHEPERQSGDDGDRRLGLSAEPHQDGREEEQSDGRGQDVDLDLEELRAVEQPGPQRKRRGGERRPREEPARCFREREPRGSGLGNAARLRAGRSGPAPAAGHGCPREPERDDGEHRPAEVGRGRSDDDRGEARPQRTDVGEATCERAIGGR